MLTDLHWIPDGSGLLYSTVNTLVPNTVFRTLLYLRLRRLIPFAIAHALMDGASVLLPLLTA